MYLIILQLTHLNFSTTSDGSHNSGSEYTTGVTHNSSTQVTIVVASGAPNLFYYCSSHSEWEVEQILLLKQVYKLKCGLTKLTSTFKTVPNVEAWVSGSSTINSKQRPGGCGTQTAGLACGGLTAPPASALATTEEYNGSGWTAAANINTARGNTKLIGTQTAAVYTGKGSPSTPYAGTTELYNGTAWTSTNPNPANDAYNYRSGCKYQQQL